MPLWGFWGPVSSFSPLSVSLGNHSTFKGIFFLISNWWHCPFNPYTHSFQYQLLAFVIMLHSVITLKCVEQLSKLQDNLIIKRTIATIHYKYTKRVNIVYASQMKYDRRICRGKYPQRDASVRCLKVKTRETWTADQLVFQQSSELPG
jgi:hypothetical protein